MINIGITAVGGGIGQAVLRALRYSSLSFKTVGMDTQSMSLGLYWVDSPYLVPPFKEEDAYLGRLFEISKKENLEILIPGHDFEVALLSQHKNKFREFGCEVLVSSHEVVNICQNKYNLSQFCLENNLPFVATYSLSDAQKKAHDLRFPLIIKPIRGSASVGARLIHTPEELRRIPSGSQMIIQKYLESDLKNSDYMLKESENGSLNQINEISVQLSIGKSGKILGSFVSINRLKRGEPVEIVPHSLSSATDAGMALANLLIEKGLRGPLNLQGRLTPEGFIFFEANVRFTGITGIRSALGFREVDAALWSFILDEERKALECLDTSPGYLAFRYFDDAIVPERAVDRIISGGVRNSSSRYSIKEVPKCVLITGASGYLGSNLVARLLEIPEIEEVRAGVRNELAGSLLQKLFDGNNRLKIVYGELPHAPWNLDHVDTLIHLAAARSSAKEDLFFAINYVGTRKLMKNVHESGVKRLIYMSSQAIYGGKKGPLWTEAIPPQPENSYSLSKWGGELECLNQCYEGLQSIVLRAARIYGKGFFLRWEELLHKWAVLAVDGQPLPIYGKGETKLDLLHIRDSIDAVVESCRLPMRDSEKLIFNIGGGNPISVQKLAQVYRLEAEKMRLKELQLAHLNGKGNSEQDFGMSIRKAKSHLGWQPKVSLMEGIYELMEFAIQQKKKE